MENRKIFFAANVKFLRNRKKISQEELALQLNITRAKLAAIELGETKSPQPEDYLNVSEYFKISVDALLKIDLSKLGELKVRELEAGNDVYMAGGNIRVLAITVNKQNVENVEYVPVKAKAGYKAGYSDPEFIATLPKYSFPDLPKMEHTGCFQRLAILCYPFRKAAISWRSMFRIGPVSRREHLVLSY
ncbi:helix-turn-helix domain-containing protein [Pedobacter sp. MC2016-24]|uniref:helix-turn-helix domain-containing protein n=1 Tax=Pedobacter sp. MC2016-24 TaxID=2780090 RepID=UPI001D16550D|nr:helix-turn-helix transcriptional regulator [Pedobacter sp. MC2016-24]